MKTAIWKFPIQTTDFQTIEMPQYATILTVQTQFDMPCIWAEVNPEAPMAKRLILVYGTGHPMDDKEERKYIGTYQLQGGSLVFHVFELLRLNPN